MLARGLGVRRGGDASGHASTAITEGHYIEPDRTIDFRPADLLERTLRPVDPDGALLARPESAEEDRVLDAIDPTDAEDPAELA